MTNLIIFLATGAYAGYSSFAPGTVGTLVGVLLYWYFPQAPTHYLLYVFSLFAIGVWASSKAEIIFDEQDSSRIVLDEIVGYLVAMFMIPKTIWFVLMGFFIFRIFDIIKPTPIDQFDEVEGGFAVMFDDVLAGLYTNICLQIFCLLFV